MLTTKTIYEGQVGLRFERGRISDTLEPGRYSFWGGQITIKVLDVRPQIMLIGGQEFQCADGAPLRMSVIVSSRISDAKTYFMSGGGPNDSAEFAGFMSSGRQTLHYIVQVAMREWAMSKSMEEALESRDNIAETLLETVAPQAPPIGLGDDSLKLLDFGFLGNLKAAHADVLKAELEGKAAMARARNEAATMRSLMNTARLVRENPGLLELRVLTSGQKPRVHFNVGAPAVSEQAESDTIS